MNRLFIRVKETARTSADESIALEDSLTWLLLSEVADVIESGSNMSTQQLHKILADKELSYQDVIIFPPEHRISTRRLSLSKGQHRHIEKITPYLLEEFFAQPPEDLHFTLLNKKNKNAIWVTVVAKERMSAWLSSLVLMGWGNARILPVSGLLPFWPEQQDDVPFLYACEQDYLLKDGDSIIHVPDALVDKLPKREEYQISCDQEYLDDASLEGSPLENFLKSNVTFTPRSLWSNTKVNEKGKMHSWFYTLASTVQVNGQMLVGNLCHGIYRQKTASKVKIAPWLCIAALALFSVSAELYLSFKHTSELNQQVDRIQKKSAADFLKLVPDEGRVFYLNRQIQGRIQKANQGGGNKQAVYTIYEMMAMIDQVRAKVTGIHRIIKLDFANKEFRLDWQAQERDTLDQVQSLFQTSTINAVMEQVSKRGEGYLASIKITMEE